MVGFRCRAVSLFALLSLVALSALDFTSADSSVDKAYENFACPARFDLLVDDSKREKWCIVSWPAPQKGTWGPLCNHLWGHDIGMWLLPDAGQDCPRKVARESNNGITACTVQLDYSDLSLLPPWSRLIPVCDGPEDVDDEGMVRYGFGIREQLRDPWGCPEEVSMQRVVCERPSWVAPTSLDLHIPTFESVVQHVAYKEPDSDLPPHIHVTIATHEYAPLAAAWYHYHTKLVHHKGTMVVAMDIPAYTYLRNNGVVVAFMPSILPLKPCCLRRFRMIPWRATNDVKVRTILQALKLGVNVLMEDMDVHLMTDYKYDSYNKVDLVRTFDYSFMFTHSKSTPGMIEMWEKVYEQVELGGWDQTQFGYYGKNSTHLTQHVMPRAKLVRAQNMEANLQRSMVKGMAMEGLSYQHPDLVGVSKTIMWDKTSVCNQQPKREVDWKLYKACVEALILTAKSLGRTGVVAKSASSAYSLAHMTRWFPLVEESLAVAGNVIPAAESRANGFVLEASSLRGGFTGSAFASEKLIYLGGNPDTVVEAMSSKADAGLLHQLRKFVAPHPPSRLSFSCMRHGGPASETNKDPKCAPRRPDKRS